MVPAPLMPPQFFLLHSIEGVGGAHFLLCGRGHHISWAALPRELPARDALEAAVASIRRSFGQDRTLLVFEHGPGRIDGAAVACGGCHMSHNHVHLVVVPRKETPTLAQVRSWVERELRGYGWGHPVASRTDSLDVAAGLADQAGDNPYLHIGLIGPSSLGHPHGARGASTYVQGKLSEHVPSRLFQQMIAPRIWGQHTPLAWDRQLFFPTPGEPAHPDIVPFLVEAAYTRSTLGNVIGGSTAAPDGEAVIINGHSGTLKTSSGRELARRLGCGFLDVGYLFRAITLAARRRGISEHHAAAMGALATSLRIDVNMNPARRDGSWVVIVNERWALTENDLKRVSTSATDRHAAVRVNVAERTRFLIQGRRTVMATRDGDVVVPPEVAAVVINLRRSRAETLALADGVSRESLHADRTLKERVAAHGLEPGRFATFAPPQHTHVIDVTGRSPHQVAAEMLSICGHAGVRPSRGFGLM
jgi:cytidylate kinase